MDQVAWIVLIIVLIIFKVIFWSVFCWRMSVRRRVILVTHYGAPASTVVSSQTGQHVGHIPYGDRAGIVNNEVPPAMGQPGVQQPPPYYKH